MDQRKVEIRFEEGERLPWRIYWSCTNELADSRRFATLEDAGPVARELMDPTLAPRRPMLERIG